MELQEYGGMGTQSNELTLTWRDVSVYVKLKNKNFFGRNPQPYKRLINSVSGVLNAGNLVILMGPSGAGKSTLMTALAHRNASDVFIEGDLRINGEPLGSFMHQISGYMHQDDLFVGTLTVREHLQFMARLKLDKNKSGREINETISKILTEMNLTKCANTRIGRIGEEKGISGGEKKRLAFATETLTDPLILFCDEPTTGLDSFSAHYIVNIMKEMTLRGKTILCTIHQPSSDVFEMFQQLILLADGRIAFMGTTKSALDFFQMQGYAFPPNYNPAELLIRALSMSNADKIKVKRLCDEFAVSKAAREIDDFIMSIHTEKTFVRREQMHRMVSMAKRKCPSFFVKIYWLTYRSFVQVMRDSSIQNVRILQKLGIALMASLCFFGSLNLTQAGVQSVQGAIFIIVTENTFPPMYGVLSLIPDEFPLFLREHKSYLYSTFLYYISKMISVLPGLIVEPILFVLVAYFITGLRRTAYAFFMTNLIAILTTNVAAACGFFFSCAFENISIALAFLVPVDYTLMVTSGIFIKLSSMSVAIAWFKYLSWFMYANEALTILQWEHVDNITCDQNVEIPCLENGADVLDKFDFAASDLFNNLIAMSSLYCFFHLLAYLLFWWRTKKNS